MRIVLDTNVLLSAAFFPGVCEKLLARCLVAPDLQIVLSEHILTEFREHGLGKLKGSPEPVGAALAELRRSCEIVEPAPVSPDSVGDADDLPVLGTALAGQADYLVTGDSELLALGEFHSIPLLSPRDLLNRLERA